MVVVVVVVVVVEWMGGTTGWCCFKYIFMQKLSRWSLRLPAAPKSIRGTSTPATQCAQTPLKTALIAFDHSLWHNVCCRRSRPGVTDMRQGKQEPRAGVGMGDRHGAMYQG